MSSQRTAFNVPPRRHGPPIGDALAAAIRATGRGSEAVYEMSDDYLNVPRRLWQNYPQIEAHRARLVPLLVETGTPVFLGERQNFTARFQELVTSLDTHWGEHVVGYSFKTNYQVAQCGIFQQLGAWAEVVSGREYRLARELGYAGTSIIFNGPYKSDSDLRLAVEEQALVNVNDQGELDRLVALLPRDQQPLDMGIRISSTLPKLGHSRFGFSLENGEATAALATINANPQLHLVALHTHLYGDTDDAQLYAEAARRMGTFARQHILDYQRTLRLLDLGGGFPAHSPRPKSRDTWNPQPIEVYIRTIADALRPFFDATNLPKLAVEPGRFLTCDGIVLVTRVIHVKQRPDVQVVHCDGSISMVPLTHYCPQAIRVFTPQLRPRRGGEQLTRIHGSTCRENDLLYQGMFPTTETGDFLVHFAAGAYNASLSPDFIFATPPLELF